MKTFNKDFYVSLTVELINMLKAFKFCFFSYFITVTIFSIICLHTSCIGKKVS